MDLSVNITQTDGSLKGWVRLNTIVNSFLKNVHETASIGLGCLCALVLLASCCILCLRVHGRHAGVLAGSLMYLFFGNVCNLIGAMLSHQLTIQVNLGVWMVFLDAVKVAAVLLPVCCNSSAVRRQRMERRRRRQTLLAVSGLVVLGCGGWLSTQLTQNPPAHPGIGRRLSHLVQDQTADLGYVLGLLHLVIAWTSKLPVLSKAYRGEVFGRGRLWSGVLCFLAGVLYSSAVLVGLGATQPWDSQQETVLAALPWILAALGSAVLEVLILAVHWCRKGSSQQCKKLSPYTEHLLRGSPPSSPETQHCLGGFQGGTSAPGSITSRKKPLLDLGRYMDVDFQPVRKMCLKQVKLSMEKGLGCQQRSMGRVDEDCTSASSSDSSLSSDLEWDFEMANIRWIGPCPQEQVEKFPLQEWPQAPRPPATCPSSVAPGPVAALTNQA